MPSQFVVKCDAYGIIMYLALKTARNEWGLVFELQLSKVLVHIWSCSISNQFKELVLVATRGEKYKRTHSVEKREENAGVLVSYNNIFRSRTTWSILIYNPSWYSLGTSFALSGQQLGRSTSTQYRASPNRNWIIYMDAIWYPCCLSASEINLSCTENRAREDNHQPILQQQNNCLPDM